MDDHEHQGFLFEIAAKVDNLIADDRSKRGFRSHIQNFRAKVASYKSELESYKKAAEADPKLLDLNYGKPPKEGYEWHSNFWAPPTDTCNPLDWFPPNSYLLWPDSHSRQLKATNYNARLPNNNERLMCYYVLLATVHDKVLTDPQYERIWFDPNYKGDRFFLDAWANGLWQYRSNLSVYRQTEREIYAKRIRAMVQHALDRVNDDLA